MERKFLLIIYSFWISVFVVNINQGIAIIQSSYYWKPNVHCAVHVPLQEPVQLVLHPPKHEPEQEPEHVVEQPEHPPPELDPLQLDAHLAVQLLQPEEVLLPVQSLAQLSQVVLSGFLQSVIVTPKPTNAMKGKDNLAAVLKKSLLLWLLSNFKFSIYRCFYVTLIFRIFYSYHIFLQFFHLERVNNTFDLQIYYQFI
jgi:hypothetical protein